MPDNIDITAGSGTVIATDQIGTEHYQKIKLAHGIADSATLASTLSGLPVQQQRPTTAALSSAIISCAAVGDNAIVTATVGQTTRAFKLFLVVAGAVDLKFKRGATDLTGAMSLGAGGSITLDFDGEPWFVTGANEAFNINLSAAVQCSGLLLYEKSA